MHPLLVVFAGLPGTGKTTLARLAAQEGGAAYLRIDAIEQALRAGTGVAAVGPEGYLVAYALAEANLRLGLGVVADAVNAVVETRTAWRQLAATVPCGLIEIEVRCSDPVEHRRRVEARVADIPGLRQPSWAEVQARAFVPWDRDRVVVDTAGCTVAAAWAAVRTALAAAGWRPA